MRDLVFFFGAGASHGAGGILPERPPLGSMLYSELARLFPHSWGSLPADVASALGENFESGMGVIYDRMGGSIPELMREMAVYFIQFRAVSDTCLYRRLLSDLRTQTLIGRACFSTLNYECVLDFEILAASQQLNYFDPPDADRVPLWKLHGSCNMFAKDVQATHGVFYGTGVTFEGGIEAFLDTNRVIERCLVETALAPVMSLYMKGKPLNVSPSAVLAVQEIWAHAVDDARVVVVLGVRPWRADGHIWGPLGKTKAPLLFIGNEPELKSWAATDRAGPIEIIGSRFRDSYDHLIRRIVSYVVD